MKVMMEPVNLEEFVLDPRGPQHPYERLGRKPWNLHWGQRKLLLSEIEFLTRYLDLTKTPQPLVVYAGAAPGIHIPFLASLFPEVTFHLWDPSPFRVTESAQIVTHQNLFTREVIAENYSHPDVARNTYFISDIRTGDFEGHKRRLFYDKGFVPRDEAGYVYPRYEDLPYNARVDYVDWKTREPASPLLVERITEEAKETFEGDVTRDLQMQKEWVTQMKPFQAMLKFRLPYPTASTPQYFPYFRGTVYYQAWNRSSSQETRLVPQKPLLVEEWSVTRYDELMAYQNRVRRPYTKYLSPLTGEEGDIDAPELLDDFDSALEIFILLLYLRRRGMSEGAAVGLSRAITNTLSTRGGLASRRALLEPPPPSKRVLLWEETELGQAEQSRKQ